MINASTELAMTIASTFGDEIEKCNKDFMSGIFELKFKKRPLTGSGEKGRVQEKLIVLDLIQCLTERGYTMCASLDMDIDVKGSVVIHRSGDAWFWYR